MTTAQDLIDETKRHLFSGQEEAANRLNGPITAGATSINFKYALGGIVQGAVLAIGLEEIRVWETDGNMAATVVQRGINGSTSASHNDLDMVIVRPKFSDFRVFKAINEEILDLSSPANGLFAIQSVDLTYNPAVKGYDITGATNVKRILEVRHKTPGPAKQFPKITNWALERQMSTADFPSGFAFVTYGGAYPGLPMHVRYATDFTQLVNTTDDVLAVSGLPTSAHDIPPMGAAVRLIYPREIKRNFSEAQSDPRRFEELPPGAILKSPTGLAQLRQTRIQAEAARLASDWPITVHH